MPYFGLLLTLTLPCWRRSRRRTPIPASRCPVPKEARAVDTTDPDRWVGNGTPASCTSRAVVRAVAKGGIIRFRCGPDPVTIVMKRTAKVVNTSRRVVIDGGGLVTLSGGGERRILYQNTCDPQQTWTTDHCDDQATPRLVVQHLTLVDGNSTGQTYDGGGRRRDLRARRAAQDRRRHVRRQPLRQDRTRPRRRRRARAVAAPGQPVYVVGSTFTGGRCSNGSALSSIGVSWSVYNSTFTDNRAIGHGANPAQPGTPGGGSGGAIYADGNDFTVLVAGSTMTGNHAREGGGAIFFVSNDRTGDLVIRSSKLKDNPSDGFENSPGIFFLGDKRVVEDSVVR